MDRFKKKFYRLIYLSAVVIISGCAVNKLPLDPGYLSTESRVGLMVVSNPIEYDVAISNAGTGAIGAVISAAVTPEERYNEALKVLKKYLNNSERVKDFCLEIFKSKGKKVSLIEEDILTFDNKHKSYKIDYAKLNDFKSPKGSGKKYFKVDCVDHFCKKDIRYLKEKFQIDELMLVFVKHGILASYLYGAEINRYTKTFIDYELINLNDNSVILKDEVLISVHCIEEWNTPPDYRNLRDGMYTSLEDALLILKQEFK